MTCRKSSRDDAFGIAPDAAVEEAPVGVYVVQDGLIIYGNRAQPNAADVPLSAACEGTAVEGG